MKSNRKKNEINIFLRIQYFSLKKWVFLLGILRIVNLHRILTLEKTNFSNKFVLSVWVIINIIKELAFKFEFYMRYVSDLQFLPID